jgi:hypothetical protein
MGLTIWKYFSECRRRITFFIDFPAGCHRLVSK